MAINLSSVFGPSTEKTVLSLGKALSTIPSAAATKTEELFGAGTSQVWQSFLASTNSVALVPPKTSGQKEVKLTVPHLLQQGNECGPTALAMAMKFAGVDPGNYHNMFSSDSFGHGPLAIKEVAKKKGFTVREENNGSLEDLGALVDQGMTPLVFGVYGGGDTSTLAGYISSSSKGHWMTVTGYRKDSQGNITHIYFNDPNKATTQCMTSADFKAKFWNNNLIPGGHCTYLAIAKKGTAQEVALKQLLPQDKISPEFALAQKAADKLEKAAYAAENWAATVLGIPQQTVDAISQAATSAWNKVTSLFA